jgi:hypothetical protein
MTQDCAIPSFEQKTLEGGGTLGVADADEKQRQQQPQILHSAENRFVQDDNL